MCFELNAKLIEKKVESFFISLMSHTLPQFTPQPPHTFIMSLLPRERKEKTF